MIYLLIVEPILLIAYLWYVIHTHAAKSVNIYVKILTLIAWLISFGLVIILPLDMYYNENKEANSDIGDAIQIVWTTLYWITFLLTWIFLPLTLDYEACGEFTFKQKMLKSLQINLIIYGIGLFAGIIFTITMLIKKTFTFLNLIAFVVVLSNAVGLTIVIFIMGWSMVAIPKSFYRESNHQIQLNNKYYWIAKSKSSLNKYELDLEDLLIQILSYQSKYKNNEELRPYIDIILEQFTEEQIETARKLRVKGHQGGISLDDMNVSKLAEIHKEAKELVWDCLRTSKKLELLTEQALFIEDVLHCSDSDNKILSGIRQARVGFIGQMVDSLQYYWYVKWWRFIQFFLFGLFVLIGGVVVFSDVMIFVDDRFNPLQYWLSPNQEFWEIQLIILIPLIYVLYCIQYGILSVRLNRYGFYDYGYTDAPSLMFSATFVSRVAFPLSFNFFWLFGMSPTDVANVVGTFNFDEYLQSFKIVLPILLIVLITCNIFDIYDKLLGALGFTRFQFDKGYSDEHIEEGQEHVQNCRKELCQDLANNKIDIKAPLL